MPDRRTYLDILANDMTDAVLGFMADHPAFTVTPDRDVAAVSVAALLSAAAEIIQAYDMPTGRWADALIGAVDFSTPIIIDAADVVQ